MSESRITGDNAVHCGHVNEEATAKKKRKKRATSAAKANKVHSEISECLLPPSCDLSGEEHKPMSFAESLDVQLANKKAPHAENKPYDYTGGRSLHEIPEWEALLGTEIKLSDVEDVLTHKSEAVDTPAPFPAEQVLSLNKHILRDTFYSRVYEDDDVMKLIHKAFVMGVEAARNTGSLQAMDPTISTSAMFAKAQAVIRQLLASPPLPVNDYLDLNPRALVAAISEYFKTTTAAQKNYTLPGLAFALGFESRASLLDFITNNKGTYHAYVLRRAITFIEGDRLDDMLSKSGPMVGHRLDMATNFDYSDTNKNSASAPSSKDQDALPTMNVNITTIAPQFTSLEDWQRAYYTQNAPTTPPLPQPHADGSKPAEIDVTPEDGL